MKPASGNRQNSRKDQPPQVLDLPWESPLDAFVGADQVGKDRAIRIPPPRGRARLRRGRDRRPRVRTTAITTTPTISTMPPFPPDPKRRPI